LAAKTVANNMRFWGKIIGTQADYYIAEADNEEEISDELKEVVEDATGANKYSYWVCSYPGGPWEKLELLHPAQVVASRKLKKYFTGKLNAEVFGYPPFSMTQPNGEIVTWQEKHLLRAQIARISSACVLTPDGVFEKNDDEDGLTIRAIEEPDDDKGNQFENTDFISTLDNWRHKQLETNQLGRCLPLKNEDGDTMTGPGIPVQKLALLPVLEANYCDNLGSSISECWTLRKRNNIVSIRNLNWPGAVSLGWAPIAGTKNLWSYANIYVGYGTKFAPKPYTPPPPPPLSMEYTPPVGTGDNGALCEEYSDAAILKDPHPLEEEEEAEDE